MHQDCKIQFVFNFFYFVSVKFTIAAVSIRLFRAEVMPLADYVISILEQIELLVKTKLRKISHRRLIMLCCSRLSLQHTTEMMASVSSNGIHAKQ